MMRGFVAVLPTDGGRLFEVPFRQWPRKLAMKECRGLRRFLLCGLEKVNGEWALRCITLNLTRLHRSLQAQTALAMATG